MVTMYFNAGLIPWFLTMNNLGLTNNFLAYVVPTIVQPFNIILVKTYIENIPKELQEAAEIDGASRFQRLLYIDVPTILPTASIMLILAVGNIMNVGFEKVLLMQNNLNLNYSEIISTYVYKVGLASGINDFSLSTAISMFNSVINFILLMIANWGSKKLSGNGIF